MNSCVCIADNCDVIIGVEEDVPSYEIATAQEEVIINVEEVDQFVAQISEATVESVKLSDFIYECR